jgi:multidrug efflux pump subunit AcrA (membrane-fusion protein)
MKRLVRFLVLGFPAAMALTGVLGACGRSTGSSEQAAAPVTVQASLAIAEKHSVQVPYEAVGTVRAKESSTLQSKLMGHVQAVNVWEGDHVESGQVLVEIDSREADAEVKRAESALREAQETRQETEKVIQATLQSKAAAEAGNELAEATFKRYQGLAESQAVSRQVLDEASAKSKGAAAEAAGASEMVLSVQAKRGEADARIEQAKAELSHAQTLLSFAKVTAPFAGIITRRTVDVGDLAAPGSPLLVVENPQQYRLETQVDEEQIQEIKLGSKVAVVLDAFGKGELGGAVAEVVPSADPASRTYVVKIDLPPDLAVRSGMFGRARFDTGEKQTLTVPATAVLQRGQLTGVYVAGEDGIARLRLITTGKHYGPDVEVLSGLEPGERIVVDKTDQIRDGVLVKQG